MYILLKNANVLTVKLKREGKKGLSKKATKRRKGEEEADIQDEYLKYFWRENFGNLLLQDAANSSQKFMDPRRSLGRASWEARYNYDAVNGVGYCGQGDEVRWCRRCKRWFGGRPLMPTTNYVHETRNNERKSIQQGGREHSLSFYWLRNNYVG